MTGREPTSDCSKEQNTASPWGRGHVHPCCRLCFDKKATAPSDPSLHWYCRQHVQKCKKKTKLLISKEAKMHSFAEMHHRHLHGSASALSRRSCSHSRRRRRRRCRPVTEMKPCHQRGSIRDNLKRKCLADHKAHLAGDCHVSPFMPSDSSPRSPFRWTCDGAWKKKKVNPTPQRVLRRAQSMRIT